MESKKIYVFQGDSKDMFQQKILLFACVFALIGSTSFAHAFNGFEVAQGDGDPAEASVLEQLSAAKGAADDEMATVTAEGDFVVPTYLLQTVEDTPQEKTTAITTKTKKSLPVVRVNQTEVTPVSEQMAVEKQLTGSTIQTQKIYNSAVTRKKEKMHKKTTSVSKGLNLTASADDDINAILSGEMGDSSSVSSNGEKKKLLLPLKGTKTKVSAVENNLNMPKPMMNTYSSVYADKIIEAAKANEDLPLIMPMDLKVSFYPNATDFSGKTIKWIKAFSYKALQDPRYVIQVRLSKENPYLQQKRLYLVQKILSGTGLSSHQMVVDYVERPVDSLILRMVKKEPDYNPKTSGKTKRVINW